MADVLKQIPDSSVHACMRQNEANREYLFNLSTRAAASNQKYTGDAILT